MAIPHKECLATLHAICPAGTSPPRGESPLSGEAIMKIDFRESVPFPVEIAKNFSTFCFSLRIL